MNRSSDQVAITGVGVISPFGRGVQCLQAGLCECRSCLQPVSTLKTGLQPLPTVGEIRDLPQLPEKEGYWLSRTDRLAVLTAMDATESAGAPGQVGDAGAVIATTVAGLSDIEPAIASSPADYYRGAGFAAAASYPPSHPADAVATWLGLRGPCCGVSAACASGAMALALAANIILQDEVPMMLAGGAEALAAFTLAGFNSLQALDPAPCRPFDQNRQGLNLGEGAAVFVLEKLAHAKARNATVWAILRGWAMTNDAFHPTAPHEQGRGLADSMISAMMMAGVGPEETGYVNAHGTGTRLNDIAETKAYETVFRDRRQPIPVSSTKSYFGHCLAAAGALEAAVTIVSMRAGVLFPTLRLAEPIDAPAVDWLRGGPRRQSSPVAMSVSAGFGGSNTSLVFELDGI